jgi:hypothetical protein
MQGCCAIPWPIPACWASRPRRAWARPWPSPAGLAALPGAIELAALVGALVAGAAVVGLAARFREPEVLILFGVALSAFAAP